MHHCGQEFGNTIIILAAHSLTGSYGYFSESKTLKCPGPCPQPPHDRATFWRLATSMETFIMLHEYAHILLQHLDDARLRIVDLPCRRGLELFTREQERELEADALACERWLAVANGGVSEVAVASGILLRFFDLCEAFASFHSIETPRTHPPAIRRWRAIQKLTRLAEKPGLLASRVDMVFDWILSGTGLPPTSERERAGG